MIDVLRENTVHGGAYVPKSVYEDTAFYNADIFMDHDSPSFRNCYFSGCRFHDMSKVRMEGCDMDQCRFEDADFSDGTFQDVKAYDTVIAGDAFFAESCDFRNVRFESKFDGCVGLTINPSVKFASFAGSCFTDSAIRGIRSYLNMDGRGERNFFGCHFFDTELTDVSFSRFCHVDMTRMGMNGCIMEVTGDFEPVINGFFHAEDCAFLLRGEGSSFSDMLRREGHLDGVVIEGSAGQDRQVYGMKDAGKAEALFSRFRLTGRPRQPASDLPDKSLRQSPSEKLLLEAEGLTDGSFDKDLPWE